MSTKEWNTQAPVSVWAPPVSPTGLLWEGKGNSTPFQGQLLTSRVPFWIVFYPFAFESWWQGDSGSDYLVISQIWEEIANLLGYSSRIWEDLAHIVFSFGA